MAARLVRDPSRVVSAFPSELGWMAACWADDRLESLTFGHRSAKSALAYLRITSESRGEVTKGMSDLVNRLQAYARGADDDFLDVAIDWSGCTQFQHAVLERCRRVPRGEWITYGQLAAQAGSPRAARAVGNIMAKNRVPLVVPCHRVVGAAGSLGGFSAPDGLHMKRRLLRLEGAIEIVGGLDGGSRHKGRVSSSV